MLTRTPKTLTAPLRHLSAEIAPGTQSVYVPVRPVPGGTPNECFGNVERVVRLQGGSEVLGWALWEWPGLMIEAEFHAVWRHPDGRLVDVSPRLDEDTTILFLPDPVRIWDGQQVNNRRRALRDDPLIREFITINDRIFGVLNAGERSREFGLVSVPREEIEPLLTRKAQLIDQLQRRAPGRNDPCTCGSGKKYKKCCASAV